MPNNRPEAPEIEAILVAAEKFARRTHTRFVVCDEKREEYIKLAAILADNACDGVLGQRGDAPSSLNRG